VRGFLNQGGRGKAEERDVNDRDDFLNWVQTTLIPAERALHNGDAGPRLAIWSTTEPVTVLGAWKNAVGVDEVQRLFRDLEASFSGHVSSSVEMIAADVVGDAAYTVAYEHTQTSVRGEPRTYTLRATQIYRRENGEWKVAHRHADTVPALAPTP
jgi:ketosteroid isomerase-like protein